MNSMIVLITGASHCGKTFLAQKLLEKYKFPYLSIDHLKMGLIRSKNTDLSVEDDNLLTDYLWPILREIIKTAIENHQNLIIEGCYIPFDWRNDLEAHYLPDIRFICLAFSEEYIRKNFDLIINRESIIESRLYDSGLTIDNLVGESRKYIDGFESRNEDVIIIDDDFIFLIDNVLRSFMIRD